MSDKKITKFDSIQKIKSNSSSSSSSSSSSATKHGENVDCEGCEGLRVMKTIGKNVSNGQNNSVSTTVRVDDETSRLIPHDFDDKRGWRQRAPPDINALGNGSWTLLHTMAAYYPSKPSDVQKQQTNTFLHALADVFPCNYCAADFRDSLRAAPPQLDTQHDFAQWLCRAHNDVNEKLGKPTFDCSLVDQRWKRERDAK
jgi:FAD-linked sulfhydryl oxidase